MKLRRFIWWGLAGLFVTALAVVVLGRALFVAYLNSDGFREKISAATGRELRAESTFLPLNFSGTTVYCDGFSARGSDAAFFSALRASQLRAEFNWRGLLRRVWQIDELGVERLEIDLRNQSASVEKEPAAPHTLQRSRAWKTDLRKASFHDSRWSWASPPGGITGTALTLTPTDGGWLIDAEGGKLTQENWPELLIEKAKLRYRPPSLFISESSLRRGSGSLAVTGELQFDRAADLQVKLSQIDLAPLLDPDWRARLKGQLSGDVTIHAPLGAEREAGVSAEGSLRLGGGRLEALPVLNQIAAFTQTQRFRELNLSKASMDFTRDAQRLSARNVILETEGLLRIEGAFTIIGGAIDGTFQVGVTPSSLQWLPGSRDRVFTTARGGYVWTPMRLTGPAAHPTEDLTPRLAAAATGEVLDTVEGTVRETAKGLLDLLKP